MTCGWCEGTELTGYCAISGTSYCSKHRNHTHTHLEIEKWVILSRSRVEPMREGRSCPHGRSYCHFCDNTEEKT